MFLVDVLSATTPSKSAEGKPVTPPKDLPTVKVTEGKPATITIPKGQKPPTKTVGQLLIEGEGAEVKAGQRIRVTYTGALWKDGKNFDSSANSPEGYFETVIGQGQVIPAWDTQLVGKKVGSRLLLVVPPKDGYGAAGSPPKISGTDTLVFVVDILAAYWWPGTEPPRTEHALTRPFPGATHHHTRAKGRPHGLRPEHHQAGDRLPW